MLKTFKLLEINENKYRAAFIQRQQQQEQQQQQQQQLESPKRQTLRIGRSASSIRMSINQHPENNLSPNTRYKYINKDVYEKSSYRRNQILSYVAGWINNINLHKLNTTETTIVIEVCTLITN